MTYIENNTLSTNTLDKTGNIDSFTKLNYNYDGVPHVFTIYKNESVSTYTKDNGILKLSCDTANYTSKQFILNNDGNAYLEIRG